MKLVAGTSNPLLASAIAAEVGMELTPVNVKRFADGEIYARIEENVRGKDVYVIQSLCPPVNDNLMELLILLDALKRSSVRRITCVIPYFGYGRQDRKVKAREPITAKLVADMIMTAGAHGVLAVDLHANQIQGYFDIPVDDIWAATTLVGYFQSLSLKDIVIVSPDAGGVPRARYIGKKLDAPIAFIDKRREAHNESEVMHVVGEVKGKNVIIVDDMIDTAGTMTKAADAIIALGAKSVRLAATHAVLSGDARERIMNCNAVEAVLTDTIPQKDLPDKFHIISIAPLLGMAIHHAYEGGSLSTLTEKGIITRRVS